jgi:hypothetical protein
MNQPIEAAYTRKVRLREEAAWRRYGPVGYRLVKLLALAALLTGTGLTFLLVNTLVAFYPGTGSAGGPAEHAIQVRVESCERLGPLHDRRLGFWWTCRVRLPDGGQAEVDRSIVTKDDVGRTVELYQACFDRPEAHCNLGEKVGSGWRAVVFALHWFGRILLLVLLGWAFTLLLAAVVGPSRFVAVIEWWQRKIVKDRS